MILLDYGKIHRISFSKSMEQFKNDISACVETLNRSPNVP